MLSRKSTSESKTKLRTLLTVTIMTLSCFATVGFSQPFELKVNSFTYPGTIVEFSSAVSDSTKVTDDETGEINYQILNKPRCPIKMNGREIQPEYVNESGIFHEVVAASSKQFNKYLIDNLWPWLEQLEDGEYMFSPMNAIVNDAGQLAYYELPGITKGATPFPGASLREIFETTYINSKLKEAIDQTVATLTENAPKFAVLYINGKAMPYGLGGSFIRIKDHKIQK